jgi:hypothetical protein
MILFRYKQTPSSRVDKSCCLALFKVYQKKFKQAFYSLFEIHYFDINHLHEVFKTYS